jgi:hypothetical protein
MNKRMGVILFILPLLFTACATNKTKPEEKVGISSDEANEPSLTKPKVRSFVVPDTIEGNKYIKSHRVYILEDPGSWSR